MIRKLIEKYKDYTILIEDVATLQFNRIDSVNNELLKLYKFYEIDHANKAIYLEPVKHDSFILIVSNDSLELPLTVVKNINQAAAFMKVEATHIYRAHRNAGRPKCLKYNNFILYFFDHL